MAAMERLEIVAWGGTKLTLQKLIDEVVDYRFQRHKTHTRVYTVSETFKWILAAVKVLLIINNHFLYFSFCFISFFLFLFFSRRFYRFSFFLFFLLLCIIRINNQLTGQKRHVDSGAGQ